MSEDDESDLFLKHIISEGESLEDIAFMYETPPEVISSLNEDITNDTLSVGEEILVSEFPSYYLNEALAYTVYCPEGLDDCGTCGGSFFFDYSLGGPCGCNGEVYIECEGDLACSNSTCPVYGCMDTAHSNYSPNATVDDGTCCSDGESYFEYSNWRTAKCGCTDYRACNYDPRANKDDGSCHYEYCEPSCSHLQHLCSKDKSRPYPIESSRDKEFFKDKDKEDVYGCTDFNCPNYDARANIDDGSCNCSGCTDPSACNYDPDAQTDDGSCEYSSCAETPTITPTHIPGCTDPNACNRDIDANVDDGSCAYLDDCGECGGNNSCFTPTLTKYPVIGCTDSNACNYNSNAEFNDGSCFYPDDCGECGGNNSCYGCMDLNACNYDPNALMHDGTCEYIVCEETPTATGAIIEYGCMDSSACNYDQFANFDDNSCDYSCYGCTDPSACNYDMYAILSDNSCEYYSCNPPTPTISPTFTPIFYIYGCTDVTSCNYDPSSEVDDGSCEYTSCLGCTEPEACNYNSFAIVNDGSCDYISCGGCMDISACNHSLEATVDDGSCAYECYGCNDILANNYDGSATRDCRNAPDGISCKKCDYSTPTKTIEPTPTLTPSLTPIDTFLFNCTDPKACNYNPRATVDDGSCEYETCYGCMNSSACNYDSNAVVDDGSCDYISCWGCMDYNALNYCADCTKNSQACYYSTPTSTNLLDSSYGCMDPKACNYNSSYSNDCISSLRSGLTEDCIPCEYYCYGCTDSNACNYDSFATIEDNSCKFISEVCSPYYYDVEIESEGGYNDFCDCNCNRFDACLECGGSAVKDSESYPEITGGSANECGTCGNPVKDDCDTCENHPTKSKYWLHDYVTQSIWKPSATPTTTEVPYIEARLFDNKSGTGSPSKCDCEDSLSVDRCDRCGDPENAFEFGASCSGCDDDNAINYGGDFLYNDNGKIFGNPCGTNHCKYNFVRVSYLICEECSKQEKGKSKVYKEKVEHLLIKDDKTGTLFSSYENLLSNFSMHTVNGSPGSLSGVTRETLYLCQAESDPYYSNYQISITGEPGDRTCNGLLGCTYEYEDCNTGGVTYVVHNDDWIIDPSDKIQPYNL